MWVTACFAFWVLLWRGIDGFSEFDIWVGIIASPQETGQAGEQTMTYPVRSQKNTRKQTQQKQKQYSS